MPIDFPCSSCHQTVRVPDGTEGKKTKCPKCQHIQVIPNKSAAGSSPTPTPPPAPQQPAKKESVWDDLTSESTPAEPPASSNPFGDAPDPFGPPSDNPYVSPPSSASSSSSYAPRPASREDARSKLMGPAIGILVTNGLGLLLMLLGILITIVEVVDGGGFNGNQNDVEVLIVAVFQFGIPLLFTILSITAMIRALAVRNYALVMTGFILSITPCSGGFCCLIGMVFGIWGIVVMNDDSVKAAFRLP
ncbi:hypothetical protein [Bremerella sp. P1]|uniref:hypothetical protein n=1 Tax=Bremerella sp. P1 TaxID=3026424 RepID=UPI0023679485|nr:hypothetical protein [Bremerella sp. P1]WDI44110.1 hypothetical protein PSR63_09205 [Bremerella sp. P1]